MRQNSLTGERLQRAKKLFESALVLNGADRAAHVELVCGEDQAMRAFVERLLANHEAGNSPLHATSPMQATTQQTADMGPQLGMRIGPYELSGRIGQGGMGTVFKGWDSLLERPVAIKFVSEGFAHSMDARQRFLREARAASRLTHKGIATVHNAGEHEGQAYIVFRLIDGETIADRLQKGPFELADALRLIGEAAEALGHAHENGVLHRDITSRNLMIDRDGSSVIVDFGLALPEMDTRLTKPGSLFGTLGYMAPEVIRGKPHDRRSDLYALGVVLYEMLTGTLPFRGERAESLLYAIVHEPLQDASARRPELSRNVDRMLAKLLAREPGDRYQTSTELITDLVRLQTCVAPVARLPSRRNPRRRWLVMMTAVAVITGLWFLLRRPGPASSGSVVRMRVAILPLQNASARPSDSDYIALGLSEALATRLTRIATLRVTPWITSQTYRPDRSLPLAAIAEELDVERLVVGSFREEGSRLQIRLSLVDPADDAQEWADEFVGFEGELLDLSKRLATAVGAALRGELGAEEFSAIARHPTNNEEAYRLYLQGASYLHEGSEIGAKLALSCFEKALSLDSELAMAQVAIGATYSSQYYYGWNPDPENLNRAEASYRAALILDPQLWPAHRGLIRSSWAQGRSEECLRIGARAEHANSDNVEVLLTRAEAYFFAGLADWSIPLLERVMALDPANRGGMMVWLYALASTGTHARKALELAEDALRRFGEDAEIYEWLAASHYALGEVEAARLAFAKARDPGLGGASLYAFVEAGLFEAELGDLERARAIWSEGIERRHFDTWSGGDLAITLLRMLIAGPEGDAQPDNALPFLGSHAMTEELAVVVYAYLGRNSVALAMLQRMADRGTLFFDTFFYKWETMAELQRLPAFADYRRRREALEQRLRNRYVPITRQGRGDIP